MHTSGLELTNVILGTTLTQELQMNTGNASTHYPVFIRSPDVAV
jgi:hypothetical protein